MFPGHVYICSDRFTGELISFYLDKILNSRCTVIHNFCDFFPTIGKSAKKPSLILWDYKCFEINRLWSYEDPGFDDIVASHYFTLFNIPDDDHIIMEAAIKGCHGVFHSHDSLDLVFKGMSVVANGDVWFSRNILMKCLQDRNQLEVSQDGDSGLSRREKEVLRLMSRGKSNDEIGDDLNISPHTVKNHVSKIYSKLGFSNRLQAMLWAAKNFNF